MATAVLKDGNCTCDAQGSSCVWIQFHTLGKKKPSLCCALSYAPEFYIYSFFGIIPFLAEEDNGHLDVGDLCPALGALPFSHPSVLLPVMTEKYLEDFQIGISWNTGAPEAFLEGEELAATVGTQQSTILDYFLFFVKQLLRKFLRGLKRNTSHLPLSMEEEVPVQTFLKRDQACFQSTQYFSEINILINIALSAWIIKLGSGDRWTLNSPPITSKSRFDLTYSNQAMSAYSAFVGF